ncbi:uncharacterized protein [Pyxicephalus adspersus]|uniref:uncharacterized protein n=1 Tax=Pyxicephalus adspersus TaxID=30357 RepID=UPI003B5A7AD2
MFALIYVWREKESFSFTAILVYSYKPDILRLFVTTTSVREAACKRNKYDKQNKSCDTMTSIPALRKDEKYHVFISYSTKDSIWVSGLIHELEAAISGLKICYHEKDFVPGKTIIDNMVECIQSSQKTLMVMSPDFVQSHWCRFEANLSMFQDCMLQKAVIPIMLKPCPIPLQLSHLTYLEADDEHFFDKLTQVLLSNNSQLVHSTLLHYQPSFFYNGKNLHTLAALNEDDDKWKPGVFSSSSVPDSLRAVIDDSRIYRKAIEIINSVPPSSWARFTVCQVVICIILAVPLVYSWGNVYAAIVTFSNGTFYFNILPFLPIVMAFLLIPTLLIQICCWKFRQADLVIREMIKKTGQANLIFSKNSVLAGCSSTTQLHFVYVSLYQCKDIFNTTFGQGSALATNMWEKAIFSYSSDYACCLAKKHFPFNCTDVPGHIEDGICFCQYVSNQLNLETNI